MNNIALGSAESFLQYGINKEFANLLVLKVLGEWLVRDTG